MSMTIFNNTIQQNIIYHVSSKTGIIKKTGFYVDSILYIIALTDSVDETSSDEIHCTKCPKIVIQISTIDLKWILFFFV